MCIALCIYNWINTQAVSWMSVAHIEVAVHIYINCMVLFLWALSRGVYHTTLSPGLLSPPSEKSFVLLLASKINWGKSAILAGSQQPWLGNPVMSEVVLAGHQCTWTPVLCDSEGKNGFTVIYSGERWWCCILMFSSICLLAAGKTLGFLVLSLSFPVFSPKYNKNQMLVIEATHINLAWNWLRSCSFEIFFNYKLHRKLIVFHTSVHVLVHSFWRVYIQFVNLTDDQKWTHCFLFS